MQYDIHQENVNSKSNHKKKGDPKDKLGKSNPMCFTIEKKSKAISAELTKKCFLFFSLLFTLGALQVDELTVQCQVVSVDTTETTDK